MYAQTHKCTRTISQRSQNQTLIACVCPRVKFGKATEFCIVFSVGHGLFFPKRVPHTQFSNHLACTLKSRNAFHLNFSRSRNRIKNVYDRLCETRNEKEEEKRDKNPTQNRKKSKSLNRQKMDRWYLRMPRGRVQQHGHYAGPFNPASEIFFLN